MSARYVLAPEAAADLVEIWLYIREHSSTAVANRVESTILERFAFLARTPEAGHTREDLTAANVKFFPMYSYLIVYRPRTKPLQIVAILHGARDLRNVLKDRI
jgi:plasmid stabilization system protein ParE